jgi:HAD superfamily hydrolase (TIGR01549 family)
MFYKAILFDLDDTLYSYQDCHNQALTEVREYLNNTYNISPDDFNIYYLIISNNLKLNLNMTASSHNRMIYFKQLCQRFKIKDELKLNTIYWDIFFKSMKPFDNVIEFLKWNKSNNIKIGIITNFQTEYQIKKLKKLNIYDLIDNLITSEEVGIEKPHEFIFDYALNQMKVIPEETIMIGDSITNDITPANKLNIYGFLLQKDSYLKHKNYTIFNNYNNLLYLFSEIKFKLNEFQHISQYCGERFDLVQAGGGNISFKFDDLLYIKSSGCSLSSVSNTNNYSILFNKILHFDILNSKVESNFAKYSIINSNRPSIETYMHCILKKYVVHLHPIAINNILIRKDAQEIISQLYPNSLFIKYEQPGLNLCNQIMKHDNYNNFEVIFLQNHGVIYNSNNIKDIYNLIETTCKTAEEFTKLDLNNYKIVNFISNLCHEITNKHHISYLSEDSIIQKYLVNKKTLFFQDPTFPDIIVYCGLSLLHLSILDFTNINNYYLKFQEIPKIIILHNNIYITSHSLNKCREIESVLKANLLILDSNSKKNILSSEEICNLKNWDAEKYRQNLN